MKQTPAQQLKWELARERFHLEEPFPPPERHPEQSIRDILAVILKKEVPETAQLPAELATHWPVIAGEQLAQHTLPAHLKNGVLYVYADHPGWLAEVRRLPKAHLLKKIASIPGISAVKEVRFKLDPAICTHRPK